MWMLIENRNPEPESLKPKPPTLTLYRFDQLKIGGFAGCRLHGEVRAYERYEECIAFQDLVPWSYSQQPQNRDAA